MTAHPVWFFGTSILLHLLAVGGLTFVPLGQQVENSIIEVQLVVVKVSEFSAPMMLASRSAPQSARSHASPSIPQLTVPHSMERAVITPVPIPKRPSPPSSRRLLQDTHASDIVAMTQLLKVAPTRSPRTNRPMTIAATPVLNTMSHAVPSIASQHPTFSMRLQGSHASPPRRVVMQLPPGTGGIERSKVGIQRMMPPIYPRVARQQRWEGTVLVRVTVRTDGRPRKITVLQSSGHEILDQAAITAVQSWVFVPARDGNIPISSMVEVPIRFNLSQHG